MDLLKNFIIGIFWTLFAKIIFEVVNYIFPKNQNQNENKNNIGNPFIKYLSDPDIAFSILLSFGPALAVWEILF